MKWVFDFYQFNLKCWYIFMMLFECGYVGIPTYIYIYSFLPDQLLLYYTILNTYNGRDNLPYLDSFYSTITILTNIVIL